MLTCTIHGIALTHSQRTCASFRMAQAMPHTMSTLRHEAANPEQPMIVMLFDAICAACEIVFVLYGDETLSACRGRTAQLNLTNCRSIVVQIHKPNRQVKQANRIWSNCDCLLQQFIVVVNASAAAHKSDTWESHEFPNSSSRPITMSY
ncbi:hypothetical protein MPSEU_001005500 [Mayamaea pseudoterrestris]|nr:hypothetical protein MPSEU_001005500 [Mayamaea pseudoterrestris]